MKDIFRKKDIGKVLADAAAGYSDGEGGTGMHKTLGVRDLTAFGIAAIVGAGIFSTIGTASYDGGPGIILLFIFVAIACAFSAFCYAEFASMVPVSGSAYTYSYVAFGEIVAWIIGWDLLMEYAIGNIAVAISWSDYFTTMLDGFGLHLPEYITMDYWTAQTGASEAAQLAWAHAPALGSFKFICDLPALLITIIITAITFVGIKETRNSANMMVALKLGVIFLVMVLGSFYIKPENWSPFLPNGIAGVLKGTAAVFFAYIGFDAISTTAEECKNPQRDLPRGMIYALIICTIIYVLIALVLTGMVNYTKLNVGDPMAFVFKEVNLNWIAGVVAISAVIATASVMLVFQVGQPRIWMSMSRDGLLPKIFSRIHPRFKTPSFSTILTGFLVGIPALFLNLKVVIDLTSVGTLFAFVLVCGGVLRMSLYPHPPKSAFKTPYLNAAYFMPVILLAVVVLLWIYAPDTYANMLRFPEFSWQREYLDAVLHKIIYILFALLFVGLTVLSVWKKLSLIPVLGLLSCSYLLCESGVSNWSRFLLWLLVGVVIYFAYGYRNSKLSNPRS
ncbi:MAG: amino acid permease [Bacteroidetes bacterium]|nr:amino acid permease [Bacteroidota bacterium]